MKKELLALLKKLNLIPADKENEITAEIDKLDLDKKPEPAVDPAKISDPVLKQIADQNMSLSQQVKTLTDALAAERTARENGIKVQQDEAKKAADKKVSDLVAQAKKDGKIVAAKEKWLTDLAASNIALAEEWVKDAPVDKSFKAEPAKDGKQQSTQADTKSTSMKNYVEHKQEFTADALAALTPSKN
ncbi:MAG: phage protease [Bacteroidota bacterium]|jgi:hypothetical protein